MKQLKLSNEGGGGDQKLKLVFSQAYVILWAIFAEVQVVYKGLYGNTLTVCTILGEKTLVSGKWLNKVVLTSKIYTYGGDLNGYSKIRFPIEGWNLQFHHKRYQKVPTISDLKYFAVSILSKAFAFHPGKKEKSSQGVGTRNNLFSSSPQSKT